ncbi:histidine kinase dimerization/phosphoacceptor domain -containing protein [uncultured Algimonas sp.]|uniref:sensor histidine kinase n=1 Tax=uncultured Algimonas sp. TaxID=1547920 RepID=UPI0026240F41|nr:histidine kinase dimerization/phosphoacceptor domain -containing protein [uncultured Algimonas sp.]
MTVTPTDSPASPRPDPYAVPSLETRWWQSVRVRYGFLLALALMPWLLVTGLEALSTLDRNRVSQNQLADVVATNTVREIARTLEAGRLGLDAVPQIIAELGCDAGSEEVLERLDVFEALIVNETEGTPICQNPVSLNGLVLENPQPFTQDRSFRIERGRIDDDGTSRHVIVLQSIVRSSGRTYTLVLPQDIGLRGMLDATLGADSIIVLAKPDGSGVVGASDFMSDAGQDLAMIPFGRETLLDMVDADGVAWRIASRYFRDLDLYVMVGRSARFGNLHAFINPLTSVLLPILAWLIGFGLIWLGTQTMLLTPIAKVRRTARQFASGRLGSRVNLSGSAANEVQGLANSFNRMAHQLQERENRIAENLDEKDTLMREIHHRVKNNLQIIISLLNMQERKAQSQDAIEAISATRTRINAIAIVHRGLYESTGLRRIDIGPFISRLLAAMGESLGTDEAGIHLTHSVEPCHLNADNAIPIALFIVEAISNAVEHGIERGGSVHIEIVLPDDDTMVITVTDNGRGVGDPQTMRGIGTKLMKGFARQLSGTLEFSDNSPGLTARLSFPIDDTPEQPFQVSRKRRD